MEILMMSKRVAPRVSIGLPVYNSEVYIIKVIDSLLAQSFKDFELIISDNASTDRTALICQDYALRDSRIRFVQQSENIGAGENFKFVLKEALGTYFMWAAGDDLRHSEFLKLAVDVIEDEDKPCLVYSYYKQIDLDTDNTFGGLRVNEFNSATKFKKYLALLQAPCPNAIYGLNRADILKQIGYHNFDYFDVHFTNWYALNHNIKIIPLFLNTIGSKGIRVPYSITGIYICANEFLRNEWRLLRSSMPFPKAAVCYMLCAYLFLKNTKLQNRIIKEHLSSSTNSKPE